MNGQVTIKLLVSDVDGTLVDKDKTVAPATVDAVRRLKAAGLGFTIISARPRSGMMPIAELLGIDEPMGAFNGGIVFKRDGTVIEHHMVDIDVVRGAMEEHEFSVFYVDGGLVKAALSVGRSDDLDQARRFISEGTNVDPKALGSLDTDLAAV